MMVLLVLIINWFTRNSHVHGACITCPLVHFPLQATKEFFEWFEKLLKVSTRFQTPPFYYIVSLCTIYITRKSKFMSKHPWGIMLKNKLRICLLLSPFKVLVTNFSCFLITITNIVHWTSNTVSATCLKILANIYKMKNHYYIKRIVIFFVWIKRTDRNATSRNYNIGRTCLLAAIQIAAKFHGGSTEVIKMKRTEEREEKKTKTSNLLKII